MSQKQWLLVASAFAIGLAAPARAQQPAPKPRPFTCTMTVGERTQEAGCYVLAMQPLERLPTKPLFWHIYSYPSLEAAQRAKSSSTATAIESFGKAWLFSIAPRDWKPAGGKREAVIGPLGPLTAKAYVARYMESTIPPGPGGTPVHRHPGPEVWYLLQGMQCIRTPGRTVVLHAGQTAFVAGGVPMTLAHSVTATRRALVLVLQDSSQPWMTKANDWKPDAQCPE